MWLDQLIIKYAGKCLEIGVKNSKEKFPLTTLGYSVLRIFQLDDAFSKILEVEVSTEGGLQLQQKEKKRRKREGKNFKKKSENPKDLAKVIFSSKN